jgi:hypothetical protein
MKKFNLVTCVDPVFMLVKPHRETKAGALKANSERGL